MHPVATLLLAVGIVLVGHPRAPAARLPRPPAGGLHRRGVDAEGRAAPSRGRGEVEAEDWTAEPRPSLRPPRRRPTAWPRASATRPASIGILIAMAAIIGKCLLDSGAADRIVRWRAGPRRAATGAPLAFLGSGFLLGDPGLLRHGLLPADAAGQGDVAAERRDYLLYVLSIVAGATMAHSLVPPTPGPLLVAGELGVDLLTMAAAGMVVGLVRRPGAATLFARWLNRRIEIPLRDSADLTIADLEATLRRPRRRIAAALAEPDADRPAVPADRRRRGAVDLPGGARRRPRRPGPWRSARPSGRSATRTSPWRSPRRWRWRPWPRRTAGRPPRAGRCGAVGPGAGPG